MRLRSAIVIVLTVAAATPAAAQRGGGLRGGSGFGAGQGSGAGREVLQACGVDLRAYCSGVQPGGGRIAQCIRRNWDKLSPACQKTILAARGGGQTAARESPSTSAAPPAPAMPAAPATPAPPATAASPPG